LGANTPKIRIDLSYTGTGFRGFQSQAKGRTVQDELESALKKIGFFPKVTGCSRTDGGVHARRYSAHFADSTPGRGCREILKGLNSNLPEEILVSSASRVGPDFHARYSSTGKTYRYFIYLGDSVPPPAAPFVSRMFPGTSPEKMAEVLPLFIGERDYRAFTTSDGRRSNTLREISSAAIIACGPLLCIEINGRSFLHRMVRFVAGALVAYARNKISDDFLASALAGEYDYLPFPALAAQGLHLWDVRYAEAEAFETFANECPLRLWPFETLDFREVGRAPL